MGADRRRAVTIGVLLILYMVGSGVVDFALDRSLPAPHLLAALLGILTEALWLGIAVTAYPILHPKAPRLAQLFVVLGMVILALGIIENVGVGGSWAHLVVRMVHGAAMLTFNLGLWRLRAVPHLLAGGGVVASLLQIGALALPFFGREVVFQLLAPTGVCQLVLALWLMAKGIDIGRRESQAVPSH